MRIVFLLGFRAVFGGVLAVCGFSFEDVFLLTETLVWIMLPRFSVSSTVSTVVSEVPSVTSSS